MKHLLLLISILTFQKTFCQQFFTEGLFYLNSNQTDNIIEWLYLEPKTSDVYHFFSGKCDSCVGVKESVSENIDSIGQELLLKIRSTIHNNPKVNFLGGMNFEEFDFYKVIKFTDSATNITCGIWEREPNLYVTIGEEIQKIFKKYYSPLTLLTEASWTLTEKYNETTLKQQDTLQLIRPKSDNDTTLNNFLEHYNNYPIFFFDADSNNTFHFDFDFKFTRNESKWGSDTSNRKMLNVWVEISGYTESSSFIGEWKLNNMDLIIRIKEPEPKMIWTYKIVQLDDKNLILIKK